jgi:hypothetical protein
LRNWHKTPTQGSSIPYTKNIKQTDQMNFATATASELAAAGYVVTPVAPKKAPKHSLLGTKSAKGKRQDQSAWAKY